MCSYSIHSPHKPLWWIYKLILIVCRKYLLLKINTVTKFLPFTMNYISSEIYKVYRECYSTHQPSYRVIRKFLHCTAPQKPVTIITFSFLSLKFFLLHIVWYLFVWICIWFCFRSHRYLQIPYQVIK